MVAASIAQAERMLKATYGYDEFRPGQRQVIETILSGGDVLAIMPTGGGKSLCYQLPGMLLAGVTIVVSPLISLMKDQVDALNDMGVRAAALNSSLSADEARDVLDRLRAGTVKLLYVAPERLDSEYFVNVMAGLKVQLFVIDEAHCVSQWGHDFRPSYLRIAGAIRALPRRPVVAAFTATATEVVADDVIKQLGLNSVRIVKGSSDRPNLYFGVKSLPKKVRTSFIRQYMQQHPNQSGIIYCATRKDVESVALELNIPGYHAGMDDDLRKRVQDAFISDAAPVIAATNAFGMGIDKPNVRYVIHHHMPDSIEAYWQEAGRAGRDGLPAECILLANHNDLNFWEGMIDRSDSDSAQRDINRQKLRQMAGYLHESGCLRAHILRYFGEEAAATCGNCCNCLDDSTEDITTQAQMILSCVKRSGERYSDALLARMLIGSKDKRLIELGMDKLSTYGIMKNYTREQVKDYIYQLINKELLFPTQDKYKVLKLTPASVDVLRGQTTVTGRTLDASEEDEYAEEEKTRSNTGRATSSTSRSSSRTSSTSSSPSRNKRTETEKLRRAFSGDELFEKLRAKRTELANKRKVPPYIIFSDATLLDMAAKRPVSIAEMRAVSGVGEYKLRQYGEDFVGVIRDARGFGASEVPPDTSAPDDFDYADEYVSPAPTPLLQVTLSDALNYCLLHLDGFAQGYPGLSMAEVRNGLIRLLGRNDDV